MVGTAADTYNLLRGRDISVQRPATTAQMPLNLQMQEWIDTGRS